MAHAAPSGSPKETSAPSQSYPSMHPRSFDALALKDLRPYRNDKSDGLPGTPRHNRKFGVCRRPFKPSEPLHHILPHTAIMDGNGAEATAPSNFKRPFKNRISVAAR